MRLSFSFAILCAAAFAMAGDGIAGTRTETISSPTPMSGSPMGVMPLLQMGLALVIVMVLLKVLLPRIAGKINKKLVTGNGSAIKVEESAAFAGGSLYIVEARGKSLLLSVTSNGVTCLADITEDSKPEDVPTFQDMVDEHITRPVTRFAAIEQEEAEEEVQEQPAPEPEATIEPLTNTAPKTDHPTPDEIEKALDRLRKLSG